MIIVINSNGGVASIQDEDLFQGSTGLNYIDLIAPFADSVTFKAMFEMPDGTYRPTDLDGYVFKPSLKLDNKLNTWRLPITFPITQDYGIVTMQIRGMIGSTVVCTTSVKLPIQKGVPYDSDYEEISDKDELLQMIADLRALLSGKTDKVAYGYEEAEDVTEETIGTYYVIEDGEYVPKTLPDDYESGVTYYTLKTTARVVNHGTDVYLEFIDEQTGASMKLDIESDKATLNSKQIVVFDDLTAENVSYDDTYSGLSAENVQEALEKLKAEIDNSANILDVGDIIISPTSWYEENGSYVFNLRHEKLTDSLRQAVILTPNDASINLLNEKNVMLYPTVETVSSNPSTSLVYAKIKADKRPDFYITANLKIVNNNIDGSLTPITANSISYSSTIGNEQVYNVASALNKLKTVSEFTYVVDSNTALSNWANNLNNDTMGTKYRSVLIKRGTYTINRGINLSATNTFIVYAEPEAYIRFNSCSGFSGDARADKKTTIFNVNVQLTATQPTHIAFRGIDNIYHCTALISPSDATSSIDIVAFDSCDNLNQCTVTTGATSSTVTYTGYYRCLNLTACNAYMTSGKDTYGFYSCENLTDCVSRATMGNEVAIGFFECKILRSCKGAGILNTWATGTGYGFSQCKGVSYCKRDTSLSVSTTATFSNSCYADISTTEDNPAYLVANTPAGGFNDIT